MGLSSDQLSEIIHRGTENRLSRVIQRSPVLLDVWLNYAEAPETPLSLLLTPGFGFGAHELFVSLRGRSNIEPDSIGLAEKIIYHETHVLARLTFAQLVRAALPLTGWWQLRVWPHLRQALKTERTTGKPPQELVKELANPARGRRRREFPIDFLFFIRAAGPIEHSRSGGTVPHSPEGCDEAFWTKALSGLLAMAGESSVEEIEELPEALLRVGLDRPVTVATSESMMTVKADAARRMFELSCEGLCWAVIDSGIDAKHPGFLKRNPLSQPESQEPGAFPPTRVRRTYDFNRLKNVLEEASRGSADAAYRRVDPQSFERLESQIAQGRSFDWKLLEPFLGIRHDDSYEPPLDDHGTHVAGILAGDWRPDDQPGSGSGSFQGVCPDLNLYDLRVLDQDGGGDEFTVLAALRFVRYLNDQQSYLEIQGINLSMSLRHKVRSYACGHSPVCVECERLVASGVVVVAAAGNSGYSPSQVGELLENYHGISITDPGNSESIITVGSTHQSMPQTYGVSYFSSRGPTADGRPKPDLVAPGEGIESLVPDADSEFMDGTSQAAPHVSGAAALLMAHSPELVGKPMRIKEILCGTATDLGRERNFQGAGLVDILRALQSL